MAPASQTPEPSSWYIVAVIFIALFVLLLSATSLVVGYLYYQKKQRANINPHPFGSGDWLDYERAAAPQSERDALAIALLELRLSVQEQYGQEADKMMELMDRNQKNLTLRLRDERRKFEAIEPEVYQRLYDEIHKPLEPPRPSLPPLIVKSTPTAQPSTSPEPSAVTSSPMTPPTSPSPTVSEPVPRLLQTTKLRDIMRSNSKSSPVRSVHIAEHPVQPSSATLTNSAQFEVIDLSDDEPVPSVGKKPSNYQAR